MYKSLFECLFQLCDKTIIGRLTLPPDDLDQNSVFVSLGHYRADNVQNSCVMFLDTTYGDFAGSTMWNPPNNRVEDCLYLNIWVPQPRKTKRPVMVSIYGDSTCGTEIKLYKI